MVAADEPLPVLIESARHRFPATRLRAIKSLGRLGEAAAPALSTLAVALDDADPKVREAAAAAIGQLGTSALATLSVMLAHPDKYVRRHAVWALGKLGPDAASMRHRLCLSLKDDDPRTASGAAQALGNLGELAGDSVPALAEAMRGSNVVLCRLAAKALSQIGRPALATLVSHLRHHDPFVRSEAAMALGWMGPMAAAAVPMLLEAVRAAERRTVAAQRAMGKPGSTPPTGTVPQPTEAATTMDTVRANAIQALGRIGQAATIALPDVQAALNDPTASVRQAAEIAMRQIGGM